MFPAAAQTPVCGSRAEITARLSDKYKEEQVFRGVNNRNGLVEIWLSPGGTWSVLITTPGMPTCMVTAGQGGEITAEPRAGKTHF